MVSSLANCFAGIRASLFERKSGISGSDGLDWKWRSVLGLPNPGVAGIASFTSGGAGLLPGVRRVRLKLLGFRFCGDGGFTNPGERIAGNVSATSGFNGKLVVDAARPVCLLVLTARFLRLRPFLAGGCF